MSERSLSPKCWACKETPVRIRMVTQQLGNVLVATICCGNEMCRSVFNVQVLGPANETGGNNQVETGLVTQ